MPKLFANPPGEPKSLPPAGKLMKFLAGRIYRKLFRSDGHRPNLFVGWDASQAPPTGDIAVWMGHASVLARLDDTWFITDPALSAHASPVPGMGPSRFFPPACGPEGLPKLDFVLISHNHYDHLDEGSVKRIRDLSDPLFIVPEGLGAWFAAKGLTKVRELPWWEGTEVNGLIVTAVPARHFSARALHDRNQTHWCGFVVSGGKRFYYTGDTGYSNVFKEIGERLGPMDLAQVPIGAYDPQWMMKDHHLNPEEGLQVFRDVKAKRMIPVHYAGFSLTYEPYTEPPERLVREAERMGLEKQLVKPLMIGEMIYW